MTSSTERTFADYASYYDLTYADKDYEAECAYVEGLITKFAGQPARRLLDIGCGSGRHSRIFADHGLAVVGVDMSDQMLAIARRASGDYAGKVVYRNGNMRSLPQYLSDCGSFDVAVAMFNVLGYQAEEGAALEALASARKCIVTGGLFICDFWHGPSVEADPPQTRIRRFSANGSRIIRIAESTLNQSEHTVSVHYNILEIEDNQLRSEVLETHVVRYFFPDEIESLMQNAGLELISLTRFMSDEPPSENDWNVTAVGRAI